MKTRHLAFPLIGIAMAFAAVSIAYGQSAKSYKMTTQIPAEITTPDAVDSRIGSLEFHDGFPTDETVQKVYDNLVFQRGVQTFLAAMPGGSAEAFRQRLASIGVNDNQSVAIFEDLMDSKSLFLTGNTESIYSLAWGWTLRTARSFLKCRRTCWGSSTTTGSNT